ncbi:hypothetical protein [Actinomadura sp. GTD37]|uniref:hypothetical protein n=1 Tax=Actinomadura sp. GTD37 TaxID=1778030 RepID=UPI0035C01F84
MRPLNVQVERHVLRWRTYRGRATAETFLSLLAVALEPRGWRPVRLYRTQGFPPPLLWIYLAPCGDAKAAAEQVEDLLKHRMYPDTW